MFTQTAGFGNPVAVVLDGEGLTDDEMARFARWTHLSETTFVLPVSRPEADYRVRIFSPTQELPFAGHPTLGTCHALLEAGAIESAETLTQECQAGLIPLRASPGGMRVFAAPPAKVSRPTEMLEAIGSQLGGIRVEDPLIVDVGPRWLTARLVEADDMERIEPDFRAIAAATRAGGWTGLTVYAVSPQGGVELRSFAPADGIDEDPVCGSGNAAVGHHLRATGAERLTGERYEARQGRFLGRDGRIHVRIADRVEVGGHCVSVIEGSVEI